MLLDVKGANYSAWAPRHHSGAISVLLMKVMEHDDEKLLWEMIWGGVDKIVDGGSRL